MPAAITVPQHIQKVAIANRTKPEKKNKAENIIEGVLTGEGIAADRYGAEDCIVGLKEVLSRSPRFTIIQPPGLDLKGTGTGILPTPLSWEVVEKICRDNGADALVVLEAFDSDSHTGVESRQQTYKNAKGGDSVVTEHVARMRMKVTMGWRIYDPKQKLIVDEFRGTEEMLFDAGGPTPADAANNLPQKRSAINKTGHYAGGLYAFRISPQWKNVHRSYYTRGSSRFKKAKRMVHVNDWKGAAEQWQSDVGKSSEKVSGRAAYNLAVANEVLGNLETALEWANKAYKEFGNRKARAYVSILENRIRDRDRLKQQLEK
jgi:hypothetical protein